MIKLQKLYLLNLFRDFYARLLKYIECKLIIFHLNKMLNLTKIYLHIFWNAFGNV